MDVFVVNMNDAFVKKLTFLALQILVILNSLL
jgi:hypothetical protein